MYSHTYIHIMTSAVCKTVFQKPARFRIPQIIIPITRPHAARIKISSNENGIHETSQERAAEIMGKSAVEYHSPMDTENLAASTKATSTESTICLTLIFNLLAEFIEDDVAETEEEAKEGEEQEEWPGDAVEAEAHQDCKHDCHESEQDCLTVKTLRTQRSDQFASGFLVPVVFPVEWNADTEKCRENYCYRPCLSLSLHDTVNHQYDKREFGKYRRYIAYYLKYLHNLFIYNLFCFFLILSADQDADRHDVVADAEVFRQVFTIDDGFDAVCFKDSLDDVG